MSKQVKHKPHGQHHSPEQPEPTKMVVKMEPKAMGVFFQHNLQKKISKNIATSFILENALTVMNLHKTSLLK